MPRPVTPVVPGFDLPVTTFAKDQLPYIPLPSWKADDGMVVTRWKFTWGERFKILLTGDLWLTLLTFNNPLQPVKVTTHCPIQGHTGHDKEIG